MKRLPRWPDYRGSIAVRLAFWFAVVALIAFTLFALVLNLVLEKELKRHQMAQIQGRTQEMHYMLMHVRPPGVADRLRLKLDAISPDDGRARYWIGSADPAFQYGTDINSVLAQTNGKSGLTEVVLGERNYRVLREDFPATEVRPAVTLIVGADTRPFRQTAHSFRVATLFITLLGVALVSALGYWVARIGLGPVDQLSRDAREIGPDNRSQRLSLPQLPTELAALGAAFNDALDRLEIAYRQLATFNDDVAHELRTPLGNLIGQTQVALTRERDAGALRELLASNLEELERLRQIVADMLFLARADQGEKAHRQTTVSIAEEVHKTLEFLEILLDEAGLQVSVEGDQQATLETALFRRALTNLLHNAMQYALPHSTITATIAATSSHASVAIRNGGVPIAEDQIHRIFDRFYRVDASRTNPSAQMGHGLGLAIVKAVAAMHGGHVFARSENGQTTIGFTLTLAPIQNPLAVESTKN